MITRGHRTRKLELRFGRFARKMEETRKRRPDHRLGVIMSKSTIPKVLIALIMLTGTFFIIMQHLDVNSVHVKSRLGNISTNNKVLNRTLPLESTDLSIAAISRNILGRYHMYRKIRRGTNMKELFDPQYSTVELDRTSGTLTAGEKLTVKISLRNGFNKKLTQGGDLLNIWLRSDNGASAVAGYIVDHMDGTYTGHVMAFWSGNVIVRVSVTNTKEGIGVYTNYVNEHGTYKFIKATFTSDKKFTEQTLCASSPSSWMENLYKGLCNFTTMNYDIPFYCGKPKKLSCANWTTYRYDDTLYLDRDSTQILRHRDKLVGEIHLAITPSSSGNLDYPVPKFACNDLSPSLTWNSTVPSGFFYKGEYQNLICRTSIKHSREQYRACLKDRHVISIGDSTTRNWFFLLAEVMEINDSIGILSNIAWQKFARAFNASLGLYTEWQPHELPFYGGEANRSNIQSVAARLDKIPSKSNAIVLIHWFGHIARCCDHVVFREHVRNAKTALIKLLERSPDVQIFIKGPHLMKYIHILPPFAYIGMYVEQVLLEEFRDLTDKIIYLEQWDMSVAIENVNIHPEPILDKVSLNNLVNFACV
ncbi:NXPE family member 4-like isoform X2 [Argopecten irradians]|uniref:NXPE family member 4-like isoform X2 n=1 Tax=Argopecten irradians TaxID=31199 RepID=UPI00371B96F6